jgi:hypothetical protein
MRLANTPPHWSRKGERGGLTHLPSSASKTQTVAWGQAEGTSRQDHRPLWVATNVGILRCRRSRHGRQKGVTAMTVAATPTPTARDLHAEIRDVLSDFPIFLTAPLYRGWHLRWGATPTEVTERLPGDGLVQDAQFIATRAITIDAPPEAVWPWLVQVGCLRAGWYSNDLLDNLAHPSARTILSDLQHLEVGQWVPMAPTPSDKTAFKLHSFEPNQWMLWSKPDSTWAWRLSPATRNQTRLVTRICALRDWRHPLAAIGAVILMEFGDFAMCRRMMRGIKSRAESPA